MPGTDGAFLSSQTRSECAGLFTKSRRTDPLAHFARVSPSARGRMTQQNERLYSPPRRGGEPPGAQRGGRGAVRRLFVQSSEEGKSRRPVATAGNSFALLRRHGNAEQLTNNVRDSGRDNPDS